MTPMMRQAYLDAGDARVAAHVATCPECQAELAALARVEDSLNALPAVEVPAALRARMASLQAATQHRALGCAETLELLEPYREGDLDAATTFLVDDHLLDCRPCTTALEQAEALAVALRTLPALEAPAVIAERLAAARVPWWQKLFPTPRVTWRVGWALAGLAMFFAAGQQMAPRLARIWQPAAPPQIIQPVKGPDTVAVPSIVPDRTNHGIRNTQPKPTPGPERRATTNRRVRPTPAPTVVPDPPKVRTPTRTPPATPSTVVEAPSPVYSAEADVATQAFMDSVMNAATELSEPKFISAMGPGTAYPAG